MTIPPWVLVVDDATVNRALACQMVRHLGYRTLDVADGHEAIAAVANHPVDLVLMDCDMPTLDGFAATARIRAHLGPLVRLPIIAMTGNDHATDRAACLGAGMDGILVKPFRLAELHALLDRWLPLPRSHIETDASSTSPWCDPAPMDACERMQAGSRAMLIGLFLDDLGPAERALATAVADGNLPEVVRIAHKLKGAALTIGAKPLGAAMKTCEREARAGMLSACQAFYPELHQVLTATRNALLAIGVMERPTHCDVT